MKKTTQLITAMVLSLALLVGCGGGGSDSKPSRGEWSDSTFTSTYAGITFAMPEGWLAATDEEIANLMGVSADVLKESGLNYNKTLLEMQNLYDMMAQDPMSGSNMILMFENLSFVAGGSQIDEAKYIEILTSQLQQTGYYDSFGEVSEQKLGANTYSSFSAQGQGAQFTQTYYLRKNGAYMTCVIVSARGDDSIEDIVKQIS